MNPEAWLAQLDPIGWRFGLDRIRRLVAALGLPQHRFASVHVVGTNGKSSVVAMAAALLEARGLRTGAYLSPHEERWAERIRVGAEVLPADRFAAAAEQVAEAIKEVEVDLDEDDVVTQFEAITATAFVAFADADVEVALVEAGLGGRLDATNVIPSRATALTSVGLEHTEYLGSTELEIAAEKLAVLRDGSVLVTGALQPDVLALARRTAAERGARHVDAARPLDLAGPAARAPYLAHNLAVAVAAAEVIAGPLEPELVREVAGSLELHGRMEVVGDRPPVVLDAAHNPDGMRALAEGLGRLGGPVVAAVAILAGKDAARMLERLAPAIDAVVCTAVPAERLEGAGRPGTQSVAPAELARLARAAGIAEVHVEADPKEAVRRARDDAAARGGVALVTGSHYLLSYGP